MEFNWFLGLAVVLTSVLAAMAGLALLTALQARRAPLQVSAFRDSAPETVFLFDGETLVDATPGARALLSQAPGRGGAWPRLMAYLAPRFPAFEGRIGALASEGRFLLTSDDTAASAHLTLSAEWRGGMARIAIADPHSDTAPPALDPLSHRAMQDELGLLRSTVAQAPLLIWRENARAEVIWANTPYIDLAMRHLDADQDLTWPLPRLFAVTGTGTDRQRLRLDHPKAPTAWYEATAFAGGDGRMVFAQPADALVQAEASLRTFTQTLTKTFAHLPIGLAIFDRQRQLALFNPALLDLTGLPPDFLSARPTLFAFLDMMRDRQMIPEPKDYRGWRQQMADLEKAAVSGRFEETWSLPGGQTYRVIGRPHPDGAMALLFEDISTEMSRTRRFRADVELGQSVIDAMEDAVAVFASGGMLVMSNAAYAELWGHDPGATLVDPGLGTILSHWRSGSAPTDIWARAEDFVISTATRQPWAADARLTDGRLANCRFVPLPGGATVVYFRLVVPAEETAGQFKSARSRRSA